MWTWPRVCHTEWSKKEREKLISYINTYMWELEKWYRWTYFQHRNRDTGHTETRGEGVSGMDWEIRTDIHALPCYHRKPVGSFHVAPGAQLHALWWPRGLGWRGGRFRRKVVHVCISLVHSIVQQKPVQHGKEIILQFLKMHANFMFYSKQEEKKNCSRGVKAMKATVTVGQSYQ